MKPAPSVHRWLILVLLTILGCGTCPAETLNATIRFNKKRGWDAEVLGRTKGDWITVRQKDSPAVIEIPISDVKLLEFHLEVDKEKMMDLYHDRRFDEVADKLDKVLKLLYHYLDIPNNMLEHVPVMLRSLHHSERYDEAIEFARTITRRIKQGPLHHEAKLYEILALLELDRIEEAYQKFREMPVLTRQDKLASLYWYALAQFQIAEGQLPAAQDTASRIVAYAAKDFEWMPAGLYLTAACYVESGEFDVAHKVIEELEMMFQNSGWSSQARSLIDRLVVEDASGNGRQGQYHWNPFREEPGVSSNSVSAVSLDGIKQYLSAGAVLDFLGGEGNDFTITIWVNPESGGAYISWGDVFSEEPEHSGLLLNHEGLRVNGVTLADERTILLKQKPKTGQWMQLACVRDSGQGQLRLYVNGALAGAESYDAKSDFAYSTGEFLVGARYAKHGSSAVTDLFKGKMDDIQVYGNALAGGDIAQLYRNPGTPLPEGRATMLAHYRLDEGTVESEEAADEDPEEALEDEQTAEIE